MDWIELSPGYACNCRCTGCFSCSPEASAQMAWPEVERWLRYGRRKGARHVWLSGGEPTLRRDLRKTLKLAKFLGYERIKVQSNGMLFAYPGFAAKAAQAGMNEVNLLLKSLDPALHDELNQTPRSHELLSAGLTELRAVAQDQPMRLAGDILLTSRNWRELPELVAHYLERGLVHFNIWLFSLVDQGDEDLRALIPRLGDAVPKLLEAVDLVRAAGASLCSLNTPHCLIPPAYWSIQFDAAGMGLAVVNPGGQAFMLEDSAMEQGVFFERCGTCAVRAWCHGMRADYLAVHGDDELQPVSVATAAGHDPRGGTLSGD